MPKVPTEEQYRQQSLSSIRYTDNMTSQNSIRRYNRLMELLLTHAPLPYILNELVLFIEKEKPGIIGSILLLSDDKNHLIEGSAPNLPDFYNQAIDGMAIGIKAGSCGTSAYLGKRVIVADIESHEYWTDFKAVALQAGLKACWSEPIIGSENSVLGTFAMYYKSVKVPDDSDISLILEAARLAGIAIERTRAEKHQQLTNNIFDNLPYAIAITDCNFQILQTNTAFERITGYSFNDIEGLEAFMLMAPGKSSEYYREELSALDETSSRKEEITSQRKNGEDFLIEQTITVLRDSSGKIDRYIWLFDDISERKQAESVIHHQANYDLLTDLPNRNFLLERLNWAIRLCKRSQSKFGLLVLDLDHFKEINDSLGHELGDKLLIHAAERLKSHIKGSDTISRLGGDEFAIMIPTLADRKNLEVIAKGVIQDIGKPYNLIDQENLSYTTASVGIAVYPDDGDTIEALFRSADQAMYSAKEQGRNCYCFFTQGLQQKADSQAKLHQDLKVALKEDQLELYYQPILNLETNQLDKAECLIRWNHPERGIISPGLFIPIAEKTGIIKELGCWIRDQACSQVKQLINNGLNIRLSVNVSRLEFWSGELVSSFLDNMEKYSVIADFLTVEITESLFLKNQKEMTLALSNLRTLGVKISIDDFGTGYSSLSYLGNFPLDELKIDRSFINGIEGEERKQSLVEAIITLSHKLGMKVVAEGIETKGQFELLKSKGCDYAQGFYYAKPMPAKAFTEFATQHWIEANSKYAKPQKD
ncbi:bifunctional diguanylate cyclase/phosphodiesterase [Litoribacillus peritrichatus]|uniref:EAL domain-containing protein n=1 Tax=Litoribacillus peritrichatus TaxID=718191 RepID=A0ABP7N0P8_9GAMM